MDLDDGHRMARGHPVSLLPLTPAALFQDDASAFAERVTLRCVSELDARFPAETLARVTVTHCGERHVSPVTAPRGEASSPLGWPELEDKFLAASRFAARPEQQAQVVAAMHAARARDLASLARTLAALRLPSPAPGN